MARAPSVTELLGKRNSKGRDKYSGLSDDEKDRDPADHYTPRERQKAMDDAKHPGGPSYTPNPRGKGSRSPGHFSDGEQRRARGGAADQIVPGAQPNNNDTSGKNKDRGGKAKPTSKNSEGPEPGDKGYHPGEDDEYMDKTPGGRGQHYPRIPQPGQKGPRNPDDYGNDHPDDRPKHGPGSSADDSRKIPARSKKSKIPKTGLATYGSQVK